MCGIRVPPPQVSDNLKTWKNQWKPQIYFSVCWCVCGSQIQTAKLQNHCFQDHQVGTVECLGESDRSLSTVLLAVGGLAKTRCPTVAGRSSVLLMWPWPSTVLKPNVFTIECSLLTIIIMNAGYIAWFNCEVSEIPTQVIGWWKTRRDLRVNALENIICVVSRYILDTWLWPAGR